MNTTTEQFDLARILSESQLVCIEIGLAEIEGCAGSDASQIHASEITKVTVKAILIRPEHVADILLVSSWLFAEALCTDAQRDLVRSHWLTIAQGIEDSLS
jgi:hypothetical protein